MDTMNSPMSQGPSVPPATPAMAPRHKNWVVLLVFILVAVIVGVLLIYQAKWLDFNFPTNEINTDSQSFNNELDNVNSDNLDAEFMDIEADLNSL